MIKKEINSSLFYKILDTIGNETQYINGKREKGLARAYRHDTDDLCLVKKVAKNVDVIFTRKNNIELKTHSSIFGKLKSGLYLYDYQRKIIVFDYSRKILNDELFNLVPDFDSIGTLFHFGKTNELFRVYNNKLKLFIFITSLLGTRFLYDLEIDKETFKTVIAQTFHRVNVQYKHYKNYIHYLVEHREKIFSSQPTSIYTLKKSQLEELKQLMLPAFVKLTKEEKQAVAVTIITLEDIRKNGIPYEYFEIAIPGNVNFKGKSESFTLAFTYAGKIYIQGKNNISIPKFKKACNLKQLKDDDFRMQRVRI